MEGYKLRHTSTGLSTQSFDDSATLCGSDDWDLESFMNEDPVSASNTSGLSPTMIFAIQKKDKSTVRKLLESGQDPLTGDRDGCCALHHTVRADSKRVMRELFDSSKLKGNPKGLNQKDRNGATALQYAASIGRKSMVKELLLAGTDKDAADNHGRSPLFMAVEGNYEEIVELLLDNKAKVTPQLPPRFKEMQSAIIFRKRMETKKKKY
jgi:ankyrin repeat protein